MKLLQKLDDMLQVHTCGCGQEFEFLGTIVAIYTATSKTKFPDSADWKQVTGASMKVLA
jgi:hypothetical protein